MKRKLIIFISITVVLIIGTITTITLLNKEEYREYPDDMDAFLSEHNDWDCNDDMYEYNKDDFIIDKPTGPWGSFHFYSNEFEKDYLELLIH